MCSDVIQDRGQGSATQPQRSQARTPADQRCTASVTTFPAPWHIFLGVVKKHKDVMSLGEAVSGRGRRRVPFVKTVASMVGHGAVKGLLR
ncbi:hypothetical protein PYCC9005_000454 [Savitreella phatthalungensis]